MKLSGRIAPTSLLTMLADLQEADEARLIEHVQACYEAMRTDIAIKDAGLPEIVVPAGERRVTLMDAAQTFAKVGVLEQFEPVSLMGAYVDAVKEFDSLWLGTCKSCRSRWPRMREKGRRG